MPSPFNIEPPAWLTKAAFRYDPAESIAAIAGPVAGAAISTAIGGTDTGQKEGFGTNFLSNLIEAHNERTDSMYDLKRKQAMLNVQSSAVDLEGQHAKLDLTKQTLEATAQDKKSLPKWLAENNTWQKRSSATPPDIQSDWGWQKYSQITQVDSQLARQSAIADGTVEINRTLDQLRKIDPVTAAQFAGKQDWSNSETVQRLQTAVSTAQDKIDSENDAKRAQIADWESKDYNVKQWTDSRGRIQYSKTPPKSTVTGREAAIVQALKYAESQDALAAKQQDPDLKAALEEDAQRARAWADKQGKFKPVDDSTVATEKLYNPEGKEIMSVRTKTPRSDSSAAKPDVAPSKAAGKASGKGPSQSDVAWLLKHPGDADMFDAHFGKGKAKELLDQL